MHVNFLKSGANYLGPGNDRGPEEALSTQEDMSRTMTIQSSRTTAAWAHDASECRDKAFAFCLDRSQRRCETTECWTARLPDFKATCKDLSESSLMVGVPSGRRWGLPGAPELAKRLP